MKLFICFQFYNYILQCIIFFLLIVYPSSSTSSSDISSLMFVSFVDIYVFWPSSFTFSQILITFWESWTNFIKWGLRWKYIILALVYLRDWSSLKVAPWGLLLQSCQKKKIAKNCFYSSTHSTQLIMFKCAIFAFLNIVQNKFQVPPVMK